MRFQLITNDNDTMVGMRLAGISGVMAKNEQETRRALLEAVKMEDVAIILITEGLVNLCRELVYDLKNKSSKPLIVEIPDSKSAGRKKDSITRYIRDAIGLKI